MSLLPVALYGLEVPAGGRIIPAIPDFPATFRITMAAIDPSAGVNDGLAERATLKLIRQPIGPGDDDSDENSDEEAYMNSILAASGSDDDEEEEEEANGGPSDPAKFNKARKAAALEKLIHSLDNPDTEDEEMEEAPNGVNGVKNSDKKGKSKATDESGDEAQDEDSEDDDSEDLEIEEFVICTLDPDKACQQPLDITIAEDERVFFKVNGGYAIHLTGNYVIPDDKGHNHHHEVYDSDEDEDEDGDYEYDLSPDEHELMLGVDDESDELDGLDDPRVTEVESEEEAPKLVSKAQKKAEKRQEKKGKNKRGADALEDGDTLDDQIAKTAKPAEAVTNGTQKLSKKQLKKLKNNNGEAVPTKADGEIKSETAKEAAPASKSDKKVQFAKDLEQGPSGSSDSVNKDVEGKEGKKKAVLGVKTVQGVKIDDREIGRGPAAKKGDRVGMRYIGKLTDGKVFDSNKHGKPFSFKIGVGEVVKGWDIGVAGMSIGGQRRLTIPPHLAYGSKSLPGIPANSTLVFDIKLLQIQ